MSTGRQFQMVYLLLEKGRMTARELAEQLEVSPARCCGPWTPCPPPGCPSTPTQGATWPRKVLPAQLVFKGQGWYLQAYDLERAGYCTFRLSRILPPGSTGETFHRCLEPPDINYPGDIPPLFQVDARLRFAPYMAHRVYDEFDQGYVTR